MNTEIAIIGGGAAGLAAATVLSKTVKRTVIIERNPRVGKKLLSTGNGRCNLGNVNAVSEKSAYHGDVDFAAKVFAEWQGAERFFADLGLICRRESAGRLYPYSNTANSVSDALRLACTKAEILTDTPCTGIVRENGGFLINGNMKAKKLIWACGGFGSDFSHLQKLGHSVIKPFPALCPIQTDKALCKPLKGLRVYALCKAVVGGEVIKSEQGEVQFNENSLSGICIMNLSHLVRDYGNAMTVSLDIAPEFTIEQLRSIPLTGLFHRRIAETIAKHGKLPHIIKDWRFPVTGVAPQSSAQIMSGGIPAAELNSDLSSKLCPNLYIIGETVNVDGDCGGYNLEWAWASANIAGMNV